MCGSGPKDPQADAVLFVTMLDLTTSGIAIVRKPLLDCEHTRTMSMARTNYPGCFSHLRAQKADGSRVVGWSGSRMRIPLEGTWCGERGTIQKELPDKDSNLEPSG